MHAESDDLLNWTKTQDKLTFTPQEGYDPDDWRDPFVIWNEENRNTCWFWEPERPDPRNNRPDVP